VIEPDDGICAIGSGGPYALAAARALTKNTKMNAKEIALEAMRIASEICIFTNGNFTVEEL
jgi:ATP-dependent HslUV protease subunit HslV